GGGAIGAYFLLKEESGIPKAFGENNILTIAPSIVTGCAVSGVSRCSAVAISPLTGAVGEGQAGGSIGPAIKKAGYDAIVITGRAKKLSYLFVSNDTVEVRDAIGLCGKSVGDVYDALNEQLGGKNLSIIQCGPAGEKKVRFASLMVDRNDVVGRTGLGAVMGDKNLRAVAVKGESKVDMADPEGINALKSTAKKNLETAGFPGILKRSGTAGVVAIQASGGNLATHNFSEGHHQDNKKLDASSFEEELGAGKSTCFGCIVSCRKRVAADAPYKFTNKLGAPEFETLSLLGSNLDIFDAAAVCKANDMCNQYGLDTITMGNLAAYYLETLDKGLVPKEFIDENVKGFGSPETLFHLIDQVGCRDGVGDLLAEGFAAVIEKFGSETSEFAIHVKGQGFPAHMPQVKPSQAIMYAVSPTGAEHMTSEHDWFLGGGGEDGKGLGITGKGDAGSTTLSKVQMTVYSQYFYCMLDTLTLCMFVWGPGNLFSYRDLEDLVNSMTGWKCTLWELMKVGERKVNMMRVINQRLGFSRKDDTLPERMFKPLSAGPSKGKHVDRERFPSMLDEYYALMGWDIGSGNPSKGKLMELGLDWLI
ncbi:hypothetical protein KKA14_12150, partial [bacterium]|nr:hypothetical protein [bacterium]